MHRALTTTTNSARVAPYSKSKSSQRDDSNSNLDNSLQSRYSNYQNIELENATTVCHQFKKLLTDKSNIPGSNNSQTQAGISEKMKELEWRDGAVEYYKKFYRLTVGS
ncbi:hypothetical protein XANCAGTX0491_003644 [Xanthoria calcicola]